MSKNVVKVGGFDYEPEALNSITESAGVDYAINLLREYAVAEFTHELSAEGVFTFKPATAKESRAYMMWQNVFDKFKVVFASDRNSVFENVGQLLEVARNDPDGFEKLYEAAIKANPQFKPEEPKAEAEGEKVPDPLGV